MPTEFETGFENYAELRSDDFDAVAGDTPDPRPVTSQPNDWSIEVLRNMLEEGDINLQPRYQREYVWDLKPALPPRLIESLLLDIPIPPLYLGKLPGDKLEVIDGQQRLTTLIRFVRNEFPLKLLQRRTDLNGYYYRDLPTELQRKIKIAPIRSIVVDPGGNTDLRYELFERLNRGSMPLNEAELRNCVYRGPFCDLLAELESDPSWRKVKGGDKPELRFVEREIILRFFAFANRIEYYGGSLKGFLNEYMGKHAPQQSEEIEAQRAMFKQTMRNLYTVFGEHSGRLYSTGPEDKPKPDGKWESKFSVSAFDIQASALIGYSHTQIQAAAEQIREAYLFYLLTNPQVRLAISRQPAGTNATKTRWFGFKAEVQRLLNDIYLEPRFFSYDFRRQLYDRNPMCQLCGNQIHTFEDATVDHIAPYSKGGRTVPENAQLAHRSCNARKCASLESIAVSNLAPDIIRSSSQMPTNTQTRATRTRVRARQAQSPVVELDRLFPCTLDENSSLSYKRPYSFVFSGQVYDNVGTWRHLYELFCRHLAEKEPSHFDSLSDNPEFRSPRGRQEFTRDPSKLRSAIEVSRGIYAEGNLSADEIRDRMRRLLTKFGLSYSDVILYLYEDDNARSER